MNRLLLVAQKARRISWAAAVGTGLVVVAGSVALASIPAASGVISACYNETKLLPRLFCCNLLHYKILLLSKAVVLLAVNPRTV